MKAITMCSNEAASEFETAADGTRGCWTELMQNPGTISGAFDLVCFPAMSVTQAVVVASAQL